MLKNKNRLTNNSGNEAPSLKDVLIVFIIVALLIALDWVAYFKLGWFH